MDALTRFKGLVRGSNLGHCPRKLAYQANRVMQADERQRDSTTPSDNPRFDDGHWHEFDIKRRMCAEGVVFEGGITLVHNVTMTIDQDWIINGHVDGVVNVPGITRTPWLPYGRYTLEAKSMAPGSFWKFIKSRYREGFPSYFDQIQGYLHSVFSHWTPMGDEQTPVKALYAGLWAHEDVYEDPPPMPNRALIAAKNKETGKIFSEVIEADDTHWDGLTRRWRVAATAVANNELPDRLYEDSNNFECGDCPFKTDCWQDGGSTLLPVQAITSPDADNAAVLLTVGKALEKLSEQMIDAATPSLTPDTLGKFQVGNVKINKYETKNVVWDHKRLEKELPAEYLREVRIETTRTTVRRDVPKVTPEELRGLIIELQTANSPLLLGGG